MTPPPNSINQIQHPIYVMCTEHKNKQNKTKSIPYLSNHIKSTSKYHMLVHKRNTNLTITIIFILSIIGVATTTTSIHSSSFIIISINIKITITTSIKFISTPIITTIRTSCRRIIINAKIIWLAIPI